MHVPSYERQDNVSLSGPVHRVQPGFAATNQSTTNTCGTSPIDAIDNMGSAGHLGHSFCICRP